MSDLKAYSEKRDFEKTAEPAPAQASGNGPREGPHEGPLRFVIQKHRATRLHYDLRLEVDGVLKSWAVPKGPSLNPADKRLAAMVEDHPIDYASFEGTIPKGEYGAGEVIVWDSGVYSPDEGRQYLFTDKDKAQAEMREGLRSGKLSIHLRGRKLRGSWTLVRVHGREKDWLLIKHQDEFVRRDYDVLGEDLSVASGRSIQAIRDTAAAAAAAAAAATGPDPMVFSGARRADFPGFVPPMLAGVADAPFSNKAWMFEPKLDGYRILAAARNGEVTLYSRRGQRVTERYGPLLSQLAGQPASEIVIDGELVALDARGIPSFEVLQQYLQASGPGGNKGDVPLVYYVFDMVYLDGYDVRDMPFRSRRDLLKSTLRQTNNIRLVDSFAEDGKAVFDVAIKNGLEGAIAKKSDSTYQSGRRSGDWLKIKAMQTGDFIVGGYTMGEGNRSGSLGVLIVGYLDDADALVYSGHVGSGFDGESLARVKERLDQLRTSESPFARIPPTNGPPLWVRPELVAEVKFSQWTRDGRLRAPVFLRLRDEKSPSEARRPDITRAPDVRALDARALDARGLDGRAPDASAPNSVAQPDAKQIANDLVGQLKLARDSATIKVEGQAIALTSVDKELWPATEGHRALTKRDFLSYLAAVSPFLLPHLKDRPLTLSRYPDGINGEHFWQKHWGSAPPDFVETINIADEGEKRTEYIVCNNLPTLIWLGQTADIEFHTWYSRVAGMPDIPVSGQDVDRILDYPDFIVFDVDPYIYSGKEAPGEEPEFNRKAFDRTSEVALWLKEVLDTLSLAAFIKTSGKTGLHIYVPIVRKLEYRAVRKAAETIGRYVMQRHPADVTMDWAVEKRSGKVFIDYNQNVRGKTLASVYSPRPNPEAGVSFPLRWEEVGKVYPSDFTVLTVPALLEARGDLWKGILESARDLEKQFGQP
jgi:bifunctional non-homologous end joining protein LigD